MLVQKTKSLYLMILLQFCFILRLLLVVCFFTKVMLKNGKTDLGPSYFKMYL